MSTLAPSLARKAKQVLQTKTDEESLVQSLAALSVLKGKDEMTDCQPAELQSAIEISGVECAQELLTQAEALMSELQSLQHYMGQFMESCHIINNNMSQCRKTTNEYLESISRLEEEKRMNHEKEILIEEFLDRYQLLPEEVAVLQEGEINDGFFDILQKAQSFHVNCKELLRTQHQRAGLDLMDTMARYQETALKRVVQSVQSKCHDLVDVEAAEMDPIMKKSLSALSTRPVLYKYCAEEVTEARHHALFERFVASLSRGPRPIEMQSDDPKRYLNDMLAWVHQALASEKELLEILFKDTLHQGGALGVKDLPSISSLLDRIFVSIDRPLKARIEQVLMLPPAPVLCFELSRLLDFYFGVIKQIMGGRSSSLVESLQSCLNMAERTFHEQIHSRGIRLARNAIVIPRDFSPPPEVQETINFLLQILQANDSALKASELENDGILVSTVSAILDPLLETCQRCSDDLETGSYASQENDSVKSLISKESFMINCIEMIVSSVKDRKDIHSTWTGLKSRMEDHIERLVGGMVNSILQECGLADIMKRTKEYQRDGTDRSKIATDSALNISLIAESMRNFVSILSKSDRISEFTSISDIEVKNGAMSRMSHCLLQAYESVYDTIHDPQNGYHVASVVHQKIEYTPDDIKTVLSVK